MKLQLKALDSTSTAFTPITEEQVLGKFSSLVEDTDVLRASENYNAETMRHGYSINVRDPKQPESGGEFFNFSNRVAKVIKASIDALKETPEYQAADSLSQAKQRLSYVESAAYDCSVIKVPDNIIGTRNQKEIDGVPQWRHILGVRGEGFTGTEVKANIATNKSFAIAQAMRYRV